MKSHRKHHKAAGGAMESPASGDREYEEDLKDKPMRYTGGKPEDEAEERKHGGRAKRKHGGPVKKKKHHEMKVDGEHAVHHAGRKPRKSGGRTGSDSHPFSSARHGTEPKGHNPVDID